jgi:hypothetical protein
MVPRPWRRDGRHGERLGQGRRSLATAQRNSLSGRRLPPGVTCIDFVGSPGEFRHDRAGGEVHGRARCLHGGLRPVGLTKMTKMS